VGDGSMPGQPYISYKFNVSSFLKDGGIELLKTWTMGNYIRDINTSKHHSDQKQDKGLYYWKKQKKPTHKENQKDQYGHHSTWSR